MTGEKTKAHLGAIKWALRAASLLCFGLGLVAATALAKSESWSVVPVPDNNYEAFVLSNDRPVLKTEVIAWKPNWVWVDVPQAVNTTSSNELGLRSSIILNETAKDELGIGFTARQIDTRSVIYQYELSAGKDLDLTMLAVSFSLAGTYTGEAVMTQADGTKKTFLLPPKKITYANQATRIQLKIKNAGNITVAIDPPRDIQLDGTLRVILAQRTFVKGKTASTFKVTFPGEVDFFASRENQHKFVETPVGEGWYKFCPDNDNGTSAISMNDWLDKPAGKHGPVKIAGDHFEFSDGTPVKFWGTNLQYGGCAPDKENAKLTAARFAKYGINGVRLHKFSGSGWEGIGDPDDGTRLTPDGLERLDYFCSQLAQNGIYYGFSHTFGYKIRPGNRGRIEAYDEIEKGLHGSTYGLINFAEDVQDLMIEMVVNLLKHKNPHTGMAYAEDPALSYIELQNEDDIFFYTTEQVLKACPTYKQNLTKRFSKWLMGKYGSQKGLAEAWGFALKKGEMIEDGKIEIEGNPWFMSEEGFRKVWYKPWRKKRMLDNAAFLHETQNKFTKNLSKPYATPDIKGRSAGRLGKRRRWCLITTICILTGLSGGSTGTTILAKAFLTPCSANREAVTSGPGCSV